MIKDTSDHFIRDTLLEIDPAASGTSNKPRRWGFGRVAGATLVVGLAALLGFSQLAAPGNPDLGPEELLSASGALATVSAAIQESIYRGQYYTLAAEKWPDANIYLDAAGGSLWAYGGAQ